MFSPSQATATIAALIITLACFTSISYPTLIQTPSITIEYPLTYSLTTDHETYHAPDMIDAYFTVTNRNPYPMNFTGFGEVTWSSRYVGEAWTTYTFEGDWAFSPIIPANTSVTLTSWSFSAAKAGSFEMMFSASHMHAYDVDKIVNVVERVFHVDNLDLWNGTPDVKAAPLEKNLFGPIYHWPASQDLITVWSEEVGRAEGELSARGVDVWNLGVSRNGTLVVGMRKVDERNVGILLEVLFDKVPPGILVIRETGPPVGIQT